MLVTLIVVVVVVYLLYKFLDRVYRRPVIDCTGKYVLITGCDTGFGHSLSLRLDAKGCHVIATCLTEDGAKKLRESCSSRLKTIQLNVADESEVKDAFKVVKDILPSDEALWGVVNNAGMPGSVFGPMEWLTIDNYREIASVNLLGLINISMTFLPLIKRSKGRIVNTASVHGRTCLHGNVPYSCTKYGVEAFSDALRRQLIIYGCGVHLIEPGFHTTNIINRSDNERQLRRAWEQASPETKEEYGQEFLEEAIHSYLDTLIPLIASKSIDDVIDAYEHALFAKRPRARYVIGFDANYFWLPVQWLPEWIGDWVLEALTPNAPRPAACRQHN